MSENQDSPALAPGSPAEGLAAPSGTPTPPATPAPPVALDPQSAWELRWKAFTPDAEYHADWGIEQGWKAHASDWGYPMQAQEQQYVYQGSHVAGRVFTLAGLIVWDSAHGATIVGWPA